MITQVNTCDPEAVKAFRLQERRKALKTIAESKGLKEKIREIEDRIDREPSFHARGRLHDELQRLRRRSMQATSAAMALRDHRPESFDVATSRINATQAGTQSEIDRLQDLLGHLEKQKQYATEGDAYRAIESRIVEARAALVEPRERLKRVAEQRCGMLKRLLTEEWPEFGAVGGEA